MFGYVTPCKMELKVKDYEKFKGYYCGLCLSIKNLFGNLPRMTLNYDMTFLAILLDSLNEDKINFKKSNCIAHPLKRNIKIINNKPLDYAAFCNIALSYYKLLDNFNDNNSKSSKLLSSILKGYMKKYTNKNFQLLNYMKNKLTLLNEIEKSNKKINIDEVSHIFADLTAYIICNYYNEVDFKEPLYWLGYHLGRFIYLIDAYDDLKKDMETNNFNPINKAFNEKNIPYNLFIEQIRDRIEFNLTLSAESCFSSLQALPIKKNEELLNNILQLGLMEKIESIKLKECKKNEKSL